MSEKPDWCSQDVWDDASDATWWVDDPESVRAAHECAAKMILQARYQAFEESAKIAEARIELFTSYGSGLTGRNALKEAANSIRSQAIRQHSQKGRGI